MKIKFLLVVSLLSVAVIFSVNLTAQYIKPKRADLPPAVQKTTYKVSKGATVRGYEYEIQDGKVDYIVELTVRGHSKNVTIALDGTVLEIEEEVVMATLPAAVREGLQREAGKGTINKVESLTKNGKLVLYEATVVTGSKQSEIEIRLDGRSLSHKK